MRNELFSEQCFVKIIRVSVHNSTMVHTITVSQLPIYSAKIEVFITRISIFWCCKSGFP